MSGVGEDCDIIRRLAEVAEGDLEYHIERLKLLGRGHSWGSIHIRNLEHASRVLRLLAAQIDNAKEMVQPKGNTDAT